MLSVYGAWRHLKAQPGCNESSNDPVAIRWQSSGNLAAIQPLQPQTRQQLFHRSNISDVSVSSAVILLQWCLWPVIVILSLALREICGDGSGSAGICPLGELHLAPALSDCKCKCSYAPNSLAKLIFKCQFSTPTPDFPARFPLSPPTITDINSRPW